MKRMSGGFAAAVVMMALVAAACGSDDSTTADVSATAGTVSASPGTVVTGSPGTAANLNWVATAEPPPRVTPSLWDPRQRLEHAISLIKFPVKLPTYFPTSANKLGSASAGSDELPPNSVRILHLLYGSEEAITIDGKQVHSTMSYDLNGGPLNSPVGDLVSNDTAGYRLYKKVNGTAADGTPVQTIYMALDADSTVVLEFTGEQPTMDGIAKMLGALKVVTQ